MKSLTERQKECLVLIAQDFSRKQIADKLGVSIKAIDYHIHKVQQITGAHSAVALTIFAIQNGLVKIQGIHTW